MQGQLFLRNMEFGRCENIQSLGNLISERYKPGLIITFSNQERALEEKHQAKLWLS